MPRDKEALKSGLTSYMRSLQQCLAKVRTFFRAPQSDMLPDITNVTYFPLRSVEIRLTANQTTCSRTIPLSR